MTVPTGRHAYAHVHAGTVLRILMVSGWLILVLGMWWGIADGAATTLEELEAVEQLRKEREAPKRTPRDSCGDALILLEE